MHASECDIHISGFVQTLESPGKGVGPG